LKQGDTEAAFEYAAAGKGRAFVDLLASAEVRLDPATLGADDPELAHQLQQANELSQKIDILKMCFFRDTIPQHMIAIYDITKYTEIPRKKIQDRLDQLVAEEDKLWEDLLFRYPSIASTQRVPTITATDAKMFARELDVTLVEYYRHDTGWSAFVITPDKIWHVALPHINDDVIKQVSKWIENFYSNICLNQSGELHLLYQTAIAPLLPNLPSGSNLVLAPFGKLHLLPLAAALNPINNRFVYEDYILTLVPSVSALYTVRQEANKRAQNGHELTPYESMLSVAYPGVQGSKLIPYLKNAILEAQVVAESFEGKTQPLLYDKANCAAVIEQARNYDLLHLSCHGSFDIDYTQRSGLMLADGSLTVQRIVNELRLKNPKLVTMSACESGKARIHQGDELLGLVQAMMTIGAPTVVASLWGVNDAATCELFSQFYSNLRREECSPAVAMRNAIDAVRSHSEWQHPYYWAAFTVNGLAFIKTATQSRRIPY
jgi:CHAT domain-containing protein